MWKNSVQSGKPQMTIWHMRIACWIPKFTNTHSEDVILVAFLLQQWLHKRTSVLPYTYTACLVYLETVFFSNEVRFTLNGIENNEL